jgi:hypothetical protein
MAGHVVADFFLGTRVETKELVEGLLEIAVIARRGTREP